MPENKVRKYFSLIEAWAWCSICDDMVALRLDKKEIINGLKMGIYTKEHKHINLYPDLDDPDDLSGQEHTVFVYINDNYDNSSQFIREAVREKVEADKKKANKQI